MADSPRLLAFSGSARRASLNRKLLNVVVADARESGGAVTLIDLNDYPLPLYHGDLEDEQGLPANAAKLIDLIATHPGLLIASPEYNSMFTPLLKNTIDWCTRSDDNPFLGRVAAVVSASPGMLGGVRSMTLVRQLLTHLGCHVIPAQCIVPQADQAFDPAGALLSPRTQASARAVARQLVETTERLRSSTSKAPAR
jgi:NAD(P)H-dependent FMN reductase